MSGIHNTVWCHQTKPSLLPPVKDTIVAWGESLYITHTFHACSPPPHTLINTHTQIKNLPCKPICIKIQMQTPKHYMCSLWTIHIHSTYMHKKIQNYKQTSANTHPNTHDYTINTYTYTRSILPYVTYIYEHTYGEILSLSLSFLWLLADCVDRMETSSRGAGIPSMGAPSESHLWGGGSEREAPVLTGSLGS